MYCCNILARAVVAAAAMAVAVAARILMSLGALHIVLVPSLALTRLGPSIRSDILVTIHIGGLIKADSSKYNDPDPDDTVTAISRCTQIPQSYDRAAS